MIQNLQFLRAFAAINVVLFHIIGTSTAYSFKPLYLVFLEGWGRNGVDIFFVISGFVIYYTQVKNPKSTIEFLKLRLIRIVPLYWFLTFVAILALYSLPSSTFNSNPPSLNQIFESLFFVSSIIFEKSPIVYLGWTLEWEMLFYTIFALSLIFSSQIISNFIVLILLIIFSYLTNELIIMEFIFGIIVAYLYMKYKFSNCTGILFFIIGFALLFLTILIDFGNESRFFYWGIPSMLIIFGAVNSPQINNKFLKLLGDSSYSIYLIQMFTIPVFYKATVKFHLPFNPDFLAISCLFFSIFIGVLVYKLIEKPSNRYIRKKIIYNNFEQN